MDKLRTLVPYGYTLFNGYAMTDGQVDAYNATQDRINQFIRDNMPVPEYELHDSYMRIAVHTESWRDPAKDKRLADMYLDYFNNYLTVERFASDYGKSIPEACQIIETGRIAHSKRIG